MRALPLCRALGPWIRNGKIQQFYANELRPRCNGPCAPGATDQFNPTEPIRLMEPQNLPHEILKFQSDLGMGSDETTFARWSRSMKSIKHWVQ